MSNKFLEKARNSNNDKQATSELNELIVRNKKATSGIRGPMEILQQRKENRDLRGVLHRQEIELLEHAYDASKEHKKYLIDQELDHRKRDVLLGYAGKRFEQEETMTKINNHRDEVHTNTTLDYTLNSQLNQGGRKKILDGLLVDGVIEEEQYLEEIQILKLSLSTQRSDALEQLEMMREKGKKAMTDAYANITSGLNKYD